MSQRHHLLWYRPGEGRPHEFFLSPTLARILLGLSIALLTAIVLGAILYSGLIKRAVERDELLLENERLRREVARVDRLQAQLTELQRFGQQVKRSLTEGADLERILQAGEAVEQEIPSGLDGTTAWVQASSSGSAGVNGQPLFEVASVGSSFEFPSRWPVEGFITREFELSPVDPAQSHSGIDIAVQRGTPVRAAAGGIVIVADWTPRYGHRAIIDHGGGLLSMYGHNELLLVHPGDKVQVGAPIALAGNSGISTAPHLHLEFWVSGRPVNPRSLLPERGGDHGN